MVSQGWRNKSEFKHIVNIKSQGPSRNSTARIVPGTLLLQYHSREQKPGTHRVPTRVHPRLLLMHSALHRYVYISTIHVHVYALSRKRPQSLLLNHPQVTNRPPTQPPSRINTVSDVSWTGILDLHYVRLAVISHTK